MLKWSGVDRDLEMLSEMFTYLAHTFPDGGSRLQKDDTGRPSGITIGTTEIGYAFASQDHIVSLHVIKNMPKGTIMTLKDALLAGELTEAKRTPAMKQLVTSWLGNREDPSYWKYFYLTEPDSILQFRHSALPAIQDQVDQGNVVLPHRWQPIPHESDVRGTDKARRRFLFEEDFPEIIDLDPSGNQHDACCDEHAGPEAKPGGWPNYPRCDPEKFWYACGFHKKLINTDTRHERLKNYNLIRIKSGTGIVTIAGSEHARRCHPKKNAVCRLPT